MLDIINGIILKVTSILCTIKNIKVYVWTTSDTAADNIITGRLVALESTRCRW